MKNRVLLLLLVFALAFSNPLKAQFVNLPDSSWRNFLNTHGFSTCLNGMMLDTTCSTLSTVTSLYCSNWGISDITGIQYFSNLDSLICQGNPIDSISLLPANLKYLDLGSCQFIVLPSLPAGLTSLKCDDNFIVSLPTLPNSLIDLNVGINPLTSWSVLPGSLRYLTVGECQLTSLPVLNNNLQTLLAGYNHLTLLPTLPQSLKVLYVDYNQLTALPPLPDSINYLDFSLNQVTSIDSFPKMAINIRGEYNQLVGIPALPTGLRGLRIGFNLITSLPALTSNLFLSADSNQIQNIAFLPDSLDGLEITHNPISCLPPCAYIHWLYISNTNIHCFPNAIICDGTSDVDPDTFQLCQPSTGCPVNWNIKGSVYQDSNSNCLPDVSENFVRQIPVRLESAGTLLQICYTNSYGEYSFRAPLGAYEIIIDTSLVPFQLSCPTSGIQTVFLTPLDSLIDSLNFAVACVSNSDIAAKSITPMTAFIPGSLSGVLLNFGNLASNYGLVCPNANDSGYVYVVLRSNISYVGPSQGAIAPTSVIGDSIVWVVQDFSLINPSIDFNIKVSTDTTAQSNDLVCLTLGVVMTNDVDTSNNILNDCFLVRTSCDPNEKWMSPAEADTTTHSFTFTIHFQNTGNAPAKNIYILDTLDNDFDATTFQYIASSHDLVTQMLPGNILRFNYNEINLPDSVSDEPNSHAFVEFKIDRKNNTGLGTEISNTAYIYFDYNAAVITNTVSTIISGSVGANDIYINSDDVILYPNPTRGEFTISMREGKINDIKIFDLVGEVVAQLPGNSSSSFSINLNRISKGIYFIRVKSDKGISLKKICLF